MLCASELEKISFVFSVYFLRVFVPEEIAGSQSFHQFRINTETLGFIEKSCTLSICEGK